MLIFRALWFGMQGEKKKIKKVKKYLIQENEKKPSSPDYPPNQSESKVSYASAIRTSTPKLSWRH